MQWVLDALFLAFGYSYVLVAPYTKVEESFNIQATHDILAHSLALQNYDHLIFPGAVPRTFLGSLLLAWSSIPIIKLAETLNLVASKADLQILVRLALATWNAIGLIFLRRAVSYRFGLRTAFFFTILTCSQFHFLFWMGRTLPNMFALPMVNIGLSLLIDRAPNAYLIPKRSIRIALLLFGIATIVFRVELILLWALTSLQLLVQGQETFWSVIQTNTVAATIGAALSYVVDSYFWQKQLIPELSSFLFNVAQGQSSNWGVSPFWTYFSSYLPKLLMTGLPITYVGAVKDPRAASLLLPYIGFIMLISNLGHKEWRFIIYAVPVFNITAAQGFKYLTSRKKSTAFGQICFISALGSLLLNFTVTGLLVRTAMDNYPGGEAISSIHRLIPPTTTPPPHIHICNLAAQSGITLFQHLNSPPFFESLSLVQADTNLIKNPWTYNKTENLSIADLTASTHFTHLISEVPPTNPILARDWRLLESISSYDRVVIDKDLLFKRRNELLKDPWKLVKIQKKEQIWIYERM